MKYPVEFLSSKLIIANFCQKICCKEYFYMTILYHRHLLFIVGNCCCWEDFHNQLFCFTSQTYILGKLDVRLLSNFDKITNQIHVFFWQCHKTIFPNSWYRFRVLVVLKGCATGVACVCSRGRRVGLHWASSHSTNLSC